MTKIEFLEMYKSATEQQQKRIDFALDNKNDREAFDVATNTKVPQVNFNVFAQLKTLEYNVNELLEQVKDELDHACTCIRAEILNTIYCQIEGGIKWDLDNAFKAWKKWTYEHSDFNFNEMMRHKYGAYTAYNSIVNFHKIA